MRHAVIKTNVKNAGNIATWYRRLCAQTCYISEFVRVFVQVTYLAGGAGSVRGGKCHGGGEMSDTCYSGRRMYSGTPGALVISRPGRSMRRPGGGDV